MHDRWSGSGYQGAVDVDAMWAVSVVRWWGFQGPNQHAPVGAATIDACPSLRSAEDHPPVESMHSILHLLG